MDLHMPYATPELAGMGGAIRARAELFLVEEFPAYDPIGYGDHIYVSITKSLRTTRETQIDIANLFGLRREDVGHAGLKDKYAVSTQTFSILLPGESEEDVASLIESSLRVRVNWARRHPKKLRSGHLRGNAFTITVNDLEIDQEKALGIAEDIAESLRRRGVPNYFGPQRVGEDGKNALDGLHLIMGRRRERNRWLRRYLISAYLSHLCNRYLAARVENGLFDVLLHGDLAKKHDTGGVFTVEDTAMEQPRFDAREISFTAPIYGYRMRMAAYEAKELEDRILADSGVTVDDLRRVGADGTRRLGRLLPNVATESHPEGITLKFFLPAGGYATTVLREFLKNDAGTVSTEEEDVEEGDD